MTMTEFARCAYCDHAIGRHCDDGCADCWCEMTQRQLLQLDGDLT
ncbi:hypothetical protein SEA_BOILGATE_35 [Mycobacterium phage Boilgate]|nr:hypothetical protein SEA_BOILGATE_35 [Mycobacterium phage Boilgate]